jgi:hypothetical protein
LLKSTPLLYLLFGPLCGCVVHLLLSLEKAVQFIVFIGALSFLKTTAP